MLFIRFPRYSFHVFKKWQLKPACLDSATLKFSVMANFREKRGRAPARNE